MVWYGRPGLTRMMLLLLVAAAPPRIQSIGGPTTLFGWLAAGIRRKSLRAWTYLCASIYA